MYICWELIEIIAIKLNDKVDTFHILVVSTRLTFEGWKTFVNTFMYLKLQIHQKGLA